MTKHNKSTKNPQHLLAYKKMLERVKNSLASLEKMAAKDKPIQAVETALKDAKYVAIHLGELTLDEAELIAAYIKRDIHDLRKFLNETGNELHDWLAFDLMLAEAEIWGHMSSVADKTQLEMLTFKQKIELGPEYHTGEIIGIGTLCCVACGQLEHFHSVSHIPPCSKCHNTVFTRVRKS